MSAPGLGGPRGSTQVAAVIGSPVRHSLSPVIHNAAFAATGLDWTFVALEVAAGRGEAAVAGMRALGLAGLSVTMPHKAAVIDGLDRCTSAATNLGAVNCIYREGPHLVGDNTDGAGFLDSLRADRDIDPAGRRCAVIGAGGAGRAVAAALGEAGAAEVLVVARRPDQAERAAAQAGPVGRSGPASAVASAEVVVNATPAGMAGRTDAPRVAFPTELLGPTQVVVDLVYHPVATPLLAAAAEAGAVTVNGVGMLVHQAAHAFRRWTGTDAPVAAMQAAAASTLTSSAD